MYRRALFFRTFAFRIGFRQRIGNGRLNVVHDFDFIDDDRAVVPFEQYISCAHRKQQEAENAHEYETDLLRYDKQYDCADKRYDHFEHVTPAFYIRIAEFCEHIQFEKRRREQISGEHIEHNCPHRFGKAQRQNDREDADDDADKAPNENGELKRLVVDELPYFN